MENLDRLIYELCKLPRETQWVEFKCNNIKPDMIGANISALANGAAICEKDCAYMLWGIDDKTHKIVGTTFDIQKEKKGNEELENWLRHRLSRNADFEFRSVPINGVKVSILIIQRAQNQVVTFEKVGYIRVGSYTKKLQEYPRMEAKLWDKLKNSNFEDRSAKQEMSLLEALRLIDYSAYFDLRSIPQPTDMDGISHFLLEEGIITKQDNGLFSISNMGAIILGKRMAEFPRISRKAVRVVQYKGNNRIHMMREEEIESGYAVGFNELLKFIEALIPSQEMITGAHRETKTAYPILAIREAIANALIHQDFSITGTGPTVEIFENRIEITNSGTPLVNVRRIIDNPPKSRNERLAKLMRRLGLCEEFGTGWDKIVVTCEQALLPAPKIELFEESTRVTLYADFPFCNISREDKLWACYLHACIKYVQGEQLTNATLRERFGLSKSASASISRLIKEAIAESLIKPLDPGTAPKHMKYIPTWA